MKKTIICFVSMLLPMLASAFEGRATLNGIVYEIVTKGKVAEVVGISDEMSGRLVIPSTIEYEGVVCDVVTVKRAFSTSGKITSVVIPGSVTTLGWNALSHY